MVNLPLSHRLSKVIFWGLGLTLIHFQVQLYWSLEQNIDPVDSHSNNHASSSSSLSQNQPLADCAINLYGLPRAFRSIVLPSMKRHVIPQNPHCDYYVHAFNLSHEEAGRSGQGGSVQIDQIRDLADAVHQFHPHAQVHFAWTQEVDFWKRHRLLMNKIHSTKTPDGKNPRYFPYKSKSYKFPSTVDNIFKMWHSIETAFRLMQKHAVRQQYKHVAMLRSDVIYMTPIQIRGNNNSSSAFFSDTTAVIPAFGRFPVSDRIIYGPIQAVEPWAIHRFDHLEEHVRNTEKHSPGWAMHSERFVKYTVLPQVSQQGRFQVVEHDTMCFMRARADESIWVTDCLIGNPKSTIAPPLFNMTAEERLTPQRLALIRSKIEAILQRPCYPGNWSKPNERGPHLAMACGRMPS